MTPIEHEIHQARQDMLANVLSKGPDEIPANLHMQYNEKLLASLSVLHGIESITVEFSGYGDSGQIDDIVFKFSDPNKNAKDITEEFLQTGKPEFNAETRKWEMPPAQFKEVDLYDAVQQHVYDRLEEQPADWVNNEGGSGTWEFSAGGHIDFLVEEHYVERRTGHHADYYVSEMEF